MENPHPQTNGSPPPSQEGPSEEVIRDWLVARISTLVEAAPEEIDVRQPFASYGLISSQALKLATDLESWLKRSLSPTLAWDYPTIELLARFLSGKTAPAPAAPEIGNDVPVAGEDLARVLAQLEQLSEEDAQAVLARRQTPQERAPGT